ncbi:MAG: leucyl/phenylalanyl-tRNA--protein transferase, partial [Pseudomonadota bacterium]|nr:leucyl/phenylalanyl-tRNA--protein transferase [Pseudomonadota bacterium]
MKDEFTLTPQILLSGYAQGIFPMAESRDDPEVFWVDPRHRGIFPLDGFHISRSLARRLRKEDYEIRINGDFEAVLNGCADRDETWINPTIHALYMSLNAMDRAHSLEVWMDGELAGGVYGVTLGRAFFGESMFSYRRDASKIALAYLVDHLVQTGFTLFDTQFITPHLASLGAVEIPRKAYQALLQE